MEPILSRIGAYTTTNEDGITIDTLGMMLDVIALAKTSGVGKQEFLAKVAEIFDDLNVERLDLLPTGSKIAH